MDIDNIISIKDTFIPNFFNIDDINISFLIVNGYLNAKTNIIMSMDKLGHLIFNYNIQKLHISQGHLIKR